MLGLGRLIKPKIYLLCTMYKVIFVKNLYRVLCRWQREEAKIIAWENLQKAKAEAAIRKLEVGFFFTILVHSTFNNNV